jgi:cytidine deaminase
MLALLDAAKQARQNAYAPYSGYNVGAAVLDDRGRIHSGCNVENASFGATICAERAAVANMIAEGGKKIKAAAVLTEDGGTPCGLCLQVLSEFAADPAAVEVLCAATNGTQRTFKLSELMPHPFKLKE